jgi:hypothetical protein
VWSLPIGNSYNECLCVWSLPIDNSYDQCSCVWSLPIDNSYYYSIIIMIYIFLLLYFTFSSMILYAIDLEFYIYSGCDKRRSKLGITYYEQNSNNYWLTMVCALGTAYNPSTCDCSIHMRLNQANNGPFGQPVSVWLRWYLTLSQWPTSFEPIHENFFFLFQRLWLTILLYKWMAQRWDRWALSRTTQVFTMTCLELLDYRDNIGVDVI